MSSRRHVQRERRRTERELFEAKAALRSGEPHLALRIGRRARDAGSMNPRILVEFARLAIACGEFGDAESALRRVVAMAPNHVGAHTTLAELLWQLGRHRGAAVLLTQAVAMSPLDKELAAMLQRWRTEQPEAFAEEPGPATAAAPPPPAPPRLARFDAEALAIGVRDAGAVSLPALLSAAECAELRDGVALGAAWADREETWASAPGRVRGRYCRELVPWLRELREAAFALAAAVANRLRTELPKSRHQERRPPWPHADVPLLLSAWQQREPELSGPRPMVRVMGVLPGAELLGTGIAGGPADRRAFPLRLAVDLGPGDEAARLLGLVDDRPGRKVREKAFLARPGDGLLFLCRERFDRVGGVFGLQKVRWKWGAGKAGVVGGGGDAGGEAAERWVLDLPFDDG